MTPAAAPFAPGLLPSRAICQGGGGVVLGGGSSSQLLELLGAVASGGWRWKAGEDEEGGWRAVKSEYDGTDAFVAYCRPAASSFGFFPGTVITSLLLGGHGDVLMVSSAARTSPRRSFCPPAIPIRFLRSETRKGLQASYRFLDLKHAGTLLNLDFVTLAHALIPYESYLFN